jgi:hypothetical protein
MAKPPIDEGKAHEADRAAAAPPLAHSLVEERLFLLTVRCGCGGGPFQKLSQALATVGERQIDVVEARCPRCAETREFRFDVSSFIGRFYPRRGVSDTDEPSQLLDAVAWARWARTYLRAFEGDRSRLEGEDRVDCGILALRCLDEALKQFPRGEPELPEGRLFSHGSREAFRAAPERYGRYELMGLQLQIAMSLASSGIDPDARDPGVVAGGLVRLAGAVARAEGHARRRPDATASTGMLSALGGAPAPAPHALGAPAGPVALLPGPRRIEVSTAVTIRRYVTIAATVGALAAAALAAAWFAFGAR